MNSQCGGHWISGGYRLEAAIEAHSSIYRRQQRSARAKTKAAPESGTGTKVERASERHRLAMADCLGRFGRASHSTPPQKTIYHPIPLGKFKKPHVQCKQKPAIIPGPCSCCSPASTLDGEFRRPRSLTEAPALYLARLLPLSKCSSRHGAQCCGAADCCLAGVAIRLAKHPEATSRLQL